MIAIGIYFVMFFIILLPFIEYGVLKVGSVSLILAFYASMFNTILREYFDWKELLYLRKKQENINRVTGERAPDYMKHYVDVSSLEQQDRPPGQRDPNAEFQDGQHY